MDEEALESRLEAVERALTDGEAALDLAELEAAGDVESRLTDLEATVESLSERLADIEATTRALQGYVDESRSEDGTTARRADAALAKAAAVERALERSGLDVPDDPAVPPESAFAAAIDDETGGRAPDGTAGVDTEGDDGAVVEEPPAGGDPGDDAPDAAPGREPSGAASPAESAPDGRDRGTVSADRRPRSGQGHANGAADPTGAATSAAESRPPARPDCTDRPDGADRSPTSADPAGTAGAHGGDATDARRGGHGGGAGGGGERPRQGGDGRRPRPPGTGTAEHAEDGGSGSRCSSCGQPRGASIPSPYDDGADPAAVSARAPDPDGSREVGSAARGRRRGDRHSGPTDAAAPRATDGGSRRGGGDDPGDERARQRAGGAESADGRAPGRDGADGWGRADGPPGVGDRERSERDAGSRERRHRARRDAGVDREDDRERGFVDRLVDAL
jgi:hypothetical protein